MEKYQATLYENYGVVMREHEKVPDELLQNTEELKQHLNLSYKLTFFTSEVRHSEREVLNTCLYSTVFGAKNLGGVADSSHG